MNIPLNIDWQQILLHLFNFVLLAGGLYLLLYRPVKKFMEQREEHYRGIHEQARQAEEQAQRLMAEYQTKLAQVDEAMAQRRTAAEQELEQLRTRQLAQARQEAEAILDKAREGARREREELLARTSRELMDAVASAAEKIALGAEGDPYEQFLNLAERRDAHEQPQ